MTSEPESVDPDAQWPRVIGALACRFVLISAVFAVGYGVFAALGATDPGGRQAARTNGLTWVADLASVGVIVWLLRPEGRRLRDLVGSRRAAGLRPSVGREIGVTLLDVVLLFVALVIGSFVGNLVAYGGAPALSPGREATPAWAAWLTLLVLPVTVAIAEELVYRGYALPRLEALTGRTWLAVVIQAAAFGVQHLAFFWGALGPAALAKVIGTFLAGLVFGVLYVKQRRLLPLIVAHVVIDLVSFGALAVAQLGH